MRCDVRLNGKRVEHADNLLVPPLANKRTKARDDFLAVSSILRQEAGVLREPLTTSATQLFLNGSFQIPNFYPGWLPEG